MRKKLIFILFLLMGIVAPVCAEETAVSDFIPNRGNIPLEMYLFMAAAPAIGFAALVLFYRGKGKGENTPESGETLWIDCHGKKLSRKCLYKAEKGEGTAFISISDNRSGSSTDICAVLIDRNKQSDAALEIMTKTLKSLSKRYARAKDKADAIERSIFELNGVIRSEGLCPEMASMVILLLNRGAMYWYCVGDLPLTLVREGEAIRINRFQTVGAEAQADYLHEDISKEELQQDLSNGELTSWIGGLDPESCDRSLRPFSLEMDDEILIGTEDRKESPWMRITFAPKEES